MLHWKALIILLTVALIKWILLYKISYFAEPSTLNKSEIKYEWNLSN